MKLKFLPLAIVASIASMSSAYADWAQEGGDAVHASYAPVNLTQIFSGSWSVQYGPSTPSTVRVPTPIVVADGVVASTQVDLATGVQSIHAYDLRTGAEKWQSITEQQPYGLYIQPVIGNGTVYTLGGTNAGGGVSITGYTLQTGEKTFTANTPGSAYNFFSVRATYADNRLYFGAADSNSGIQYAVDTRTGQTTYAGYPGATTNVNPLVSGNRVISVASDALYVYDLSGNPVQRIEALTPQQVPEFAGPPILAGDHVVAANHRFANQITTFDLTNGKQAWSLTGVNSDVAVAGNEVLLVLDGAFTSLDLLSGAVNWTLDNVDLNGSALQFGEDVLATENTIFVAGARKTYIIDRASHQLIGSFAQQGTLAYSDGKLLVANRQGLYAYDAPAVPEADALAMLASGGLTLAGFMLSRRRRARAVV